MGGAALEPKNQSQASNHRSPRAVPQPPRFTAGFYFILFSQLLPTGSPAPQPPEAAPGWRSAANIDSDNSQEPRSQQPGAVCGAGTAVGLPWLRGEREKSIRNYREKHPEIQLGGCEWLTPAAGRQQVNTKPTLAGSLSPSLSFIMFKYRPSLLFFFCCCFAALK